MEQEQWPGQIDDMRRAIMGMKALVDKLDENGEWVASLTPLSQKAVGWLDHCADKLRS